MAAPKGGQPPDVTTTTTARIRELVCSGEPLTEADARDLYECSDLLELGHLAQAVTECLGAPPCALSTTRRIRYSNVCRNRCRHCRRAKAPGAEGAYTRTVTEMVDLAGEARAEGISYLQLAGGASPDPNTDYYLEMVSALRRAYPGVRLEGFAPAQLAAIAQSTHRPFREIIRDLRAAGLDALLEDGADIFDPEIRRALCPTKASGGVWLQVMRDAHEEGMVTGASMLYGHLEGPREKVEHLSRLRDLNDETHGFGFYAPRCFRSNGTPVTGSGLVSGTEDLREFAVGRVYLAGIASIRCYANDLGMKTTQIALHFGVGSVVVAVHDGEPVSDEERGKAGLPNQTQLGELLTRAGHAIGSHER
jgi:aminodeoxyfutalosine synthase